MIRPLPFIVLVTIITLVGCDNTGTDCTTCGGINPATGQYDPEYDCRDSCDTAGDTADSAIEEPDGYLVVKATVLGNEIASNVVIDGKIAGATDETIALKPGSYTFTVGDDPEVTSMNGLPVYQSSGLDAPWETADWISPVTAITVTSDEMATVSSNEPVSISDGSIRVEMNLLFEEGRWTCDSGHSVGTGEMSYAADGKTIAFPKVNEMIVTGVTMVDIDDPEFAQGSFQDSEVATVLADGTHFYAWRGEVEDDPRSTATK